MNIRINKKGPMNCAECPDGSLFVLCARSGYQFLTPSTSLQYYRYRISPNCHTSSNCSTPSFGDSESLTSWTCFHFLHLKTVILSSFDKWNTKHKLTLVIYFHTVFTLFSCKLLTNYLDVLNYSTPQNWSEYPVLQLGGEFGMCIIEWRYWSPR